MNMWLSLILRAGAVLGTLLLYRWAFHLSTPSKDRWTAVEAYLQIQDWTRRKVSAMRIWLWAKLGTTDWKLSRLRARYRSGAFGEAGT